MERLELAALGLIGLAALSIWFVPGLDYGLGLLVLLLAGGLAWTLWTGYGDRYLLLCLGEAFAIGLGLIVPALGVLVQPCLVLLVVGLEDRTLLALSALAATALAAVFVFLRQTLVPLLVGVLALALLAALLLGLEAWAARRLARSDL